MGFLRFKVKSTDGNARSGILTLKHGTVKTPEFIPVATKATVKTLSPDDLHEIGVQILICNTYHLMLQPGADVIAELGGLHKFMNWDKPLATDSGGFQAFSLGLGKEHAVGKLYFPGEEYTQSKPRGESIAHINDKGIRFRSIYDNSRRMLTPEDSIRIQEKLGADMILALDECTSPLSSKEYTAKSLERTHKWAKICKDIHTTDQALIGIVQGGHWRDLRLHSAGYIVSLGFDSYAIGGSLGKSKQDMYNILDWVIPYLPDDKTRHLLGIGAVEDIFESVERGVDLFDCVSPTRMARSGFVNIRPPLGTRKNKFRYQLLSNKYRNDKTPLDPNCNCKVCSSYSRGYIHHLLKTEELLGFNLISYHNVYFLIRLMGEIRDAINKEEFQNLKKEWIG